MIKISQALLVQIIKVILICIYNQIYKKAKMKLINDIKGVQDTDKNLRFPNLHFNQDRII